MNSGSTVMRSCTVPIMRAFLRCPFRLAGFTLIELLIVILIIGILMAIGVPAYLRYTDTANDRDAQVALMTAYKAAVAGDTEVNLARFPVASTIINDIKADEPAASVAQGNCLVGVATAPVKQVLVDPASTPSQVTMCLKSASGAIWKLSGPLAGTPTISDASTVPLSFTGNEITDATRAAGVQGDGLPADSSTGIWEATTNLAANGGFETDVSGWHTYSGSPVRSQDTSVAKFGSASMRVSVPSAGSFVSSTPSYPVSASTAYSASLWLKGDPGLKVQTILSEGDGSGSYVGDLTGAQTTMTGDWQHVTFNGAVTAASVASVYFRIGAPGGTGTFWVDGLQLEQKTLTTPYVDTHGSAASRPAATVSAPSSVLRADRGWVALRVRLGGSNTTMPSGNHHLFSWLADDNNRIGVLFNGNSWQTRYYNADVPAAVASITSNFTPGTVRTVVFTWSGSTGGPTGSIGISLDGSPFVTKTHSVPAPALPSTFHIGTYAGAGTDTINSDVLWFACGVGSLTDADAAIIGSWGSSDPSRSSFPDAAQATMVWDGSSRLGSLK